MTDALCRLQNVNMLELRLRALLTEGAREVRFERVGTC